MTVDIHIRAPRDVQTTLNYYVQAGRRPVRLRPKTRLQAYPRPTSTPMRTPPRAENQKKDASFGLDVSGFQWVTYPSVEKAFVDEERIKTVYYAEVEDILKKHAGARRIFIFDHTTRRSQGVRGLAHRVHVDQSFEAAEQWVWHHLPDEAENLLKGRYQIINVWRPIENPVAHDPLGVADFRSIDVNADLVHTRLIYPSREGGTYSVKYNPGHKWYYLSDQTPDEVTLIKCFDSDMEKAMLTPHSAFSDKTSPVDAPQRQLIEVRALVFDRE